jgi:geranylgeranyl pyrophosphate synthase
VGEELRALLGAPLDDEDRERARKLVVASEGVAATIAAAQGLLAAADNALQVVPGARLRNGLTSFLASMLEGLPDY